MISIIFPTLNEEAFIGQSIRSLKSRFNSIPYEIIVSDGKSKDRTVQIAEEAGAKVIAYTGEKRQTIAQGRNDGAKAASGEFVAFMDADCSIIEPDHFFGKIMEHFKRDPKLVAVNVSIRVLPEFETFADRWIFKLFNHYLWLMNNVLHIGMSAGEFQMIRKDIFDSLHGYNETLVASEDVDLFARLAKVGKVRFENSLTIYHTGRRGHAVGWPKLLSLWILNSVWMMTTGHAYVKEWKPIRLHKLSDDDK